MTYIVFEYNIKSNIFGKVLERDLTKEEAKSLALKLGVGHSYGETNRMKMDFNL
jgi:hypothetical protein